MAEFNLQAQLKTLGYGTGLFANPFDSEYYKDPRNSYSSAWDALKKMTYWDAKLGAYDKLRRIAILSFPSSIEPDTDSPQDKRAQEFLIGAVKRLDWWDQLRWKLLDVHAKGLAVALKQFEREGNRVYYKNIIPLPQGWFYYKLGADGPELWFRSQTYVTGGNSDFAVDPYEFAIFNYGADIENPYGWGYLQDCLYPYLQKQILTAYSLQSVQNDIDPVRWAILVKDQSGNKAAVQTALADMKSKTAAVFDEGTDIKIQPPGGVDALKSKLEFRREFSDEEAIIILGQTLTTETSPKGVGSYAQAKVHKDEKEQIITSATQDLDRQLNHQIFYPLLEANYFTGRASFITKCDPAIDLGALAKQHVDLNNAFPDFETPAKYVYHTFNIPEPVGGEAVLMKGRAPAPVAPPEEGEPGNKPGEGLPEELIPEKEKPKKPKPPVEEDPK